MRIRYFWIILIAVLLFVIIELKAQAQQKIINKEIPIATEALTETILVVDSQVASRAIPPVGFREQLENLKIQVNSLKENFKRIKTQEQLDNSITLIARICNSINTFDKTLEIVPPIIRNEVDLHFKPFRKSIYFITTIYVAANSKFVKTSRDDLTNYYLILMSYQTNWKKNYGE